MFWIRLRSSILILAIMIVSIVFGGYTLFGVLLVISMIGMMELYRVYGMQKTVPAVIGYLTAAAYYFIILADKNEYRMVVILTQLLILMTCYVIKYPKFDFKQIAVAFISIFYVAIMLSYIYKVRCLEYGEYLVWMIFISSWGSDTCAYLAGSTLGKHKITPLLSPKKSLEGCIGGVIGAALLGFLYALIFRDKLPGEINPLIVFAVVGACGSVIAQIGDLAASAIKRQNNIKDYGKILPGHGGILDRFDSVIYTAPVCYILISILTK